MTENTAEEHIDNAIEQLEAAIEKTENNTLGFALEERVDQLHSEAMLASGIEYVGK